MWQSTSWCFATSVFLRGLRRLIARADQARWRGVETTHLVSKKLAGQHFLLNAL
jgi:hypothetical protein